MADLPTLLRLLRRAASSPDGWPTAVAIDATKPIRVADLTGEAWLILRGAMVARAWAVAMRRRRPVVLVGEA